MVSHWSLSDNKSPQVSRTLLIIIIIIIPFYKRRWLTVFHWNLRSHRSSPVSRTLLSILVDLKNAAVWMISALTPTFDSSSPLFKPLETIPSVPVTSITVTLMFPSFFSSLVRSKYLSVFLLSLIFTEWFAGLAQSAIFCGFSFFVNYHTVRSSGRDYVIFLYFEITENFVRPVLRLY